jgi:hypothetical protein
MILELMYSLVVAEHDNASIRGEYCNCMAQMSLLPLTHLV